MSLMPEISQRYSCKLFKKTPIDSASIKSLLESARSAPSAKNRQAWRFVAVSRIDLLEKITVACYGQDQVESAPLIIACGTTNLDYRMPNGQLSYPIDLGLAGGFILLQAAHLGLGSCAITTFDEEQVKRIITMPSLMKIVMLVAVGQADDEPPLRSRLPFSRVCAENHW